MVVGTTTIYIKVQYYIYGHQVVLIHLGVYSQLRNTSDIKLEHATNHMHQILIINTNIVKSFIIFVTATPVIKLELHALAL